MSTPGPRPCGPSYVLLLYGGENPRLPALVLYRARGPSCRADTIAERTEPVNGILSRVERENRGRFAPGRPDLDQIEISP